ncbi:hypothetical protein DPEC_G00171700 [Dallia pectoralis]|uniref:Uncharacterized protein n=1 Tax=Dallia pectoralis TaxID=75939 RepID=A0ACC2GDH9_DALPE|nr:hypothetical protein DPEC_G00171700 [Dallia pectoralis]
MEKRNRELAKAEGISREIQYLKDLLEEVPLQKQEEGHGQRMRSEMMKELLRLTGTPDGFGPWSKNSLMSGFVMAASMRLKLVCHLVLYERGRSMGARRYSSLSEAPTPTSIPVLDSEDGPEASPEFKELQAKIAGL